MLGPSIGSDVWASFVVHHIIQWQRLEGTHVGINFMSCAHKKGCKVSIWPLSLAIKIHYLFLYIIIFAIIRIR